MFPVLQTEWSWDTNSTVNPSSGIWRMSTPSSSEWALCLWKSLKGLGGGSQWKDEPGQQWAKERLMLGKGFLCSFWWGNLLFSWLVLSQLCKRSAFCSAPHSCPLEMCNRDVFRGVGSRQVPEYYTPPSFGLVPARWILCVWRELRQVELDSLSAEVWVVQKRL